MKNLLDPKRFEKSGFVLVICPLSFQNLDYINKPSKEIQFPLKTINRKEIYKRHLLPFPYNIQTNTKYRSDGF